LAKNKLRAGLTVLGVVIGIAAVTTMVSIGESMSALVQGELSNFGTNVILVFPGTTRNSVRDTAAPTLTAADAEAVGTECPAVLAATPLVWTGGQIICGNTNWKPRDMFGVGQDYLTVRHWQLQSGGFFTARDMSSAAKVCVMLPVRNV
jgi:putative ABC transport system permease protein